MLPKYFNHWNLFGYGLYILLKEKITDEELRLAKKAINQFYEDTKILYGKEFLKFNLYMLKYLCRFVSFMARYGPGRPLLTRAIMEF